jgi:hypothetical protein
MLIVADEDIGGFCAGRPFRNEVAVDPPHIRREIVVEEARSYDTHRDHGLSRSAV